MKFREKLRNIVWFFGNFKIELVVLFLYCTICILRRTCLSRITLQFSLATYFSQDRLNGIATFFSITIGIYVAVITILAMSVIGISREMLKKGLDKPLLYVIVVGLIENICSVALAIFVPLNVLTTKILLIVVVVSVISFIKFIFLLLEIFKANMNQMAKMICSGQPFL